MTILEFRTILKKICTRETSADANNWKTHNPWWGHCAIVSLLAQDLFGGQIMRASLEGTKFAAMRSHYFNIILPVNQESARNSIGERFDMIFDFTREQFGREYPFDHTISYEERTREYLLGNAETASRYEIFKKKFDGENSGKK